MMTSVKRIRKIPFDEPYQYVTVSPGEKKTIYYSIPLDMVGFITSLGNTFFEGIKIFWYIDGILKEIIMREYGKINEPTRVEPTLMVKSYVAFTVYNTSDQEQTVEIVCDGYYISGEDLGDI